jgi:hypothetical protein
MLDRILNALTGGEEEDEYDPFSEVENDTPVTPDGDDSIHAKDEGDVK